MCLQVAKTTVLLKKCFLLNQEAVEIVFFYELKACDDRQTNCLIYFCLK